MIGLLGGAKFGKGFLRSFIKIIQGRTGRVGELTPGAYADIVFLDYFPYTPLTSGNLPWQIIFGVDGSHVTTTIVGGKVLMRDRVLLTLDEERIAAEARAIAPKVWQRFEEITAQESA